MVEILIPDDPTPFREWLENLPEDASVGVGCDSADCPLACYLKAQGAPDERVTVGPCETPGVPGTYRAVAEVFVMPEWANSFGLSVDRQFNEDTPINPAAALALLEGVSDAR